MVDAEKNLSLERGQRAEIPRIAWGDSIWFSDIDFTLINTPAASEYGSEAVGQVFASYFGEDKAKEVQASFSGIYNLMGVGHRLKTDEDWQKVEGGKEPYDRLVDNVASLQPQVEAEYGHIKEWSREIFIKVAADVAGVDVTPELVHEAAEAYWNAVTERVEIFPDARTLADVIAEHKRPLYLATSSDGRLIMQPNGLFTYDPTYSEALKRQRIEALRNRGLRFTDVSVGDPEDKPSLDFFMKVIGHAEEDIGHLIDLTKAIMLGDSYTADLQTPKDQLGFGLVVLRENQRKGSIEEAERQITTGNLVDTTIYLD